MTKWYAGIGSRDTPKEVCEQMTDLAKALASDGYILRSGGADGADKAFECGCKLMTGLSNKVLAEIYLPWNGFNGYWILGNHDTSMDKIQLVIPNFQNGWNIAQLFHPYAHNLRDTVKKLMARNAFQIGTESDNKVDFVICWTKDGKDSGGTGLAIRMAQAYKIQVYNLKNESAEEILKKIRGKNERTS